MVVVMVMPLQQPSTESARRVAGTKRLLLLPVRARPWQRPMRPATASSAAAPPAAHVAAAAARRAAAAAASRIGRRAVRLRDHGQALPLH